MVRFAWRNRGRKPSVRLFFSEGCWQKGRGCASRGGDVGRGCRSSFHCRGEREYSQTAATPAPLQRRNDRGMQRDKQKKKNGQAMQKKRKRIERAVIYERVVEHVARFTPSYNLCSYYLRGKNLSLCRSLNVHSHRTNGARNHIRYSIRKNITGVLF